MPASGRPWRTLRTQFREQSKKNKTGCWICEGSKGPIDYYAPASTPLSFAADHATPTSLGGEAVRLENLRASHFGCNSSRGNTTRGQFPTSRQW